MTIYTHAVVGLALARLYANRPMRWPYWALAAFLPILPDFDSFSSAGYGTPLGHRGLTHSLLFALLVGLCAAGSSFRYLRGSFWSLAALFFVTIASHGVLDALTKGGETIPFFWPLNVRYGNWGPVPVADLGFELPDPCRSRSLRSEFLWMWLPTGTLVGAVTAYRAWRRRLLTARKDSAGLAEEQRAAGDRDHGARN